MRRNKLNVEPFCASHEVKEQRKFLRLEVMKSSNEALKGLDLLATLSSGNHGD